MCVALVIGPQACRLQQCTRRTTMAPGDCETVYSPCGDVYDTCRSTLIKSSSDSATCAQTSAACLANRDSIQYSWRHLQQPRQRVQHLQIGSDVHQGLRQVSVQWQQRQ